MHHTEATTERPGTLRVILTSCLVAINIIVSLGLVLSSFSSMVSPFQCKYALIMTMLFPAWLIAALALFIIDLIWWRRTAMIAGVAMLVSAPWIRDFAPLNLRSRSVPEKEQSRAFTLMTYNVMMFSSQDETIKNATNAQLDYILALSPDVVCIQEAEYLQPTVRNGISDDQIAELQNTYPYIFTTKEFTILSRYRTERLPFDFPVDNFRSGDITGWRMWIDDQIVNIFVVHLRSLAFTQHQRHMFRDIVGGDDVSRDDIREARHELLPPLLAASKDREGQIRELLKYIRKFGGENVIVCGDFNDPVGCYGLYLLEHEANMRQVYSEVGLGPTITYNANKFYFRIDHILYRGNLKPYSIKRGNLHASDHYPLTATFVLNPKVED